MNGATISTTSTLLITQEEEEVEVAAEDVEAAAEEEALEVVTQILEAQEEQGGQEDIEVEGDQEEAISSNHIITKSISIYLLKNMEIKLMIQPIIS